MELEELDDEASAMAAAMGFSSFGSHKPPAKKRKFNPATDAFVSGQELEAIDRGGKKGKGSGGNVLPLGKLRQFGNEKKSTTANEDEINIDDAGEGSTRLDNRNRFQHDPSIPTRDGPRNKGNEEEIDLVDEDDDQDTGTNIVREQDEVDGPAYIDTSEPPPIQKALPPDDPEALEVQARIDALLASIEEGAPSQGANPLSDGGEESPLPPALAGIPHKPAFAHPALTMGGPRGGHDRQRGGAFSDTASLASSRPSHGEKNPRWFVDYYDPSFNDNPWKSLEAEKGIASVGIWLAPNNRSRQDV